MKFRIPTSGSLQNFSTLPNLGVTLRACHHLVSSMGWISLVKHLIGWNDNVVHLHVNTGMMHHAVKTFNVMDAEMTGLPLSSSTIHMRVLAIHVQTRLTHNGDNWPPCSRMLVFSVWLVPFSMPKHTPSHPTLLLYSQSVLRGRQRLMTIELKVTLPKLAGQERRWPKYAQQEGRHLADSSRS